LWLQKRIAYRILPAMAPELKHHWTAYNPWQAAGTAEWSWPVGEGEHYWGYSVRPFQLNSEVEVVRQWTTSDNNYRWTEHFVVRNASPGLIRFSAIVVIGA
jgi:hypothetical protein